MCEAMGEEESTHTVAMEGVHRDVQVDAELFAAARVHKQLVRHPRGQEMLELRQEQQKGKEHADDGDDGASVRLNSKVFYRLWVCV